MARTAVRWYSIKNKMWSAGLGSGTGESFSSSISEYMHLEHVFATQLTWSSLKMLRKKHNARKNSGGEQSFKVPDAYRSDVLGQSAAAPGPSPANQTIPSRNLSIPLSPALAQIKNTMTPWFWNEFTEELERWERCQKRGGRHGLGVQRWETAMQRAAIFAETYPARPPPSHVPTKSPWMNALRTTLAAAPRMPRNYTRGFIEGIVPFGRTPIGTSLIALDDWDDAYHLRVFAAVAAVVKAHGLEEAGWASARWEVYDTVSVLASLHGWETGVNDHDSMWIVWAPLSSIALTARNGSTLGRDGWRTSTVSEDRAGTISRQGPGATAYSRRSRRPPIGRPREARRRCNGMCAHLQSPLANLRAYLRYTEHYPIHPSTSDVLLCSPRISECIIISTATNISIV